MMRGTGASHPWLPEGVELWSDPSEADWVVSGLLPRHKDAVRVGSYMCPCHFTLMSSSSNWPAKTRGLIGSSVSHRALAAFLLNF